MKEMSFSRRTWRKLFFVLILQTMAHPTSCAVHERAMVVSQMQFAMHYSVISRSMIVMPRCPNHLRLSTTRSVVPTNRMTNRLLFLWVYLPPTQGIPCALGALRLVSVVSPQSSFSARLCGRGDGRCPRPAASARRDPTGRQQGPT